MREFFRCKAGVASTPVWVSSRLLAAVLAISAIGLTDDVVAQQMMTPVSFAAQSNGNFGGSIPIQLPPGTGGLAPHLAIGYSSSAPNGLMGIGFSLQGLSSITRCPETVAQDGVLKGVNYTATDRFCLDGQRLVPVSGSYSGYGANGTEYRTELDSFSQIISYGSAGTGPSYFTVRTKSGLTETYGDTSGSNTSGSSVIASGTTTIRTWALSKVQDSSGNYYTLKYTDDTANGAYYPLEIDYTANGALTSQNAVQFTLEGRSDLLQSWTAGSGVNIVNRIKQIKVFTSGGVAVRQYTLNYDNNASGGSSRLISLQECAGSGGSCMPAVTFNWQGGAAVTETGTLTAQPDGTQINGGGCLGSTGQTASQFQTLAGNFSGSGKTDFLCDVSSPSHEKILYVSNGNGTFSAPYGPWPSSGGGWCGTSGSFATSNVWTGTTLWMSGDFNGDGLTDMVCIGMPQSSPANVVVGLSVGGGNFTQPQSSWSSSSWCVGGANVLVGDFDGDGRSDLVCIGTGSNQQLSVALSQGNGNFTVAPTSIWPSTPGWCSNPNIQVADFNGDGKSDLICINAPAGQYGVALSNGDGTFTTAPSLNGWCVGGTVSVADINGDGKADLLCVDTTGHEEVAFSKGDGTFALAAAGSWPSGAAWCPAAGATVLTADINGDGKADLICQNQGNITVAYGNGDGTFSAPGGTLTWCGPNFLVIGDVNGDGAQDLACFGGTITATALATGTPDLVIGYVNALSTSPVVTASYVPIANSSIFTKGSGDTYPTQDAIGPYYVVSSVARANGIGGKLTTNYLYSGLKRDMTGRGSLGYGTVTSTDAQTNIVSSTIYNQGFPYTGLPWTATTSLSGSGNSGVLKSVVTDYQCINPATGSSTCTIAIGNRYFVAPQVVTTTAYDLNGTPLPTATTTIGYDPTYTFFGNVATISTSSTDGYSKTTTNTYNPPDLTHWWIGQVNKSQVTSTTP